jgi:uncharacterized protein
MKRFIKTVKFSFLITFCVLISQLSAEMPKKPIGVVSDFANILDEQTKSDLNSVITQVEQKTSAEMAVAIVTSLDGMAVEDYSVQLFKAWGIGKKGKDNGILVLVAPNERKVRIEVGYGLEPVLPDGLCGEIIRSQIIPEFKQGNFRGGIQRGVQTVAEIVTRGEIAPKRQTAPKNQISGSAVKGFGLLFALILGLGFFGFYKMGKGIKAKSAMSTSIGTTLISVSSFLMIAIGRALPLQVFVLSLTVALAIIFILVLAILVRSRSGSGYVGGYYGGGVIRGGKSSGGFGSFGGGSSSGGFGGFGGGFSGGGGASGSW